MTRRDRRSGGRQPRRRPLLRRLGPWLPVIAVGLGSVAIVVGVIAVNATGSAGPSVDIPVRTVSTEGHTVGPEDARVTIEEYADFQCGACALAAANLVPKVEEQYVADGRVRLIYRPMAFLGEESLWAAEAAECANDQGKFWEYHDVLFENQRQGAFAIDKLKGYAEELGLDTEAFGQCLDSHEYADALTAATQQALDEGVGSTPTFIVGEQTVVGPRSYEQLQEAIEAELRKNP